MPRKLIDQPWKRILWVAAFALLAYMPAALQLTYYRDDWYYAYDAMVGPAGVFRTMFAEDRPARGPFFELYHLLFGIAPTPYHLAMLFWRVAGGAAVVWLFHLLWPRRAPAGLMAGALFALYPGFTWWVQAIEYQPMVASAALMVVSLCLTILAQRLEGLWSRLLCVALAILTGWLYLALVEYAAGIEVLRLGLIYLTLNVKRFHALRSRVLAALRAWAPYMIVPGGFVIWRFLLFTSERKATSLGAQLSGFVADPIATGLHWLMSFLLSFINVTLAAWVQPLQTGFFSLRLREQLPALAFGLIAAIIIWMVVRNSDPMPARKRVENDEDWQITAILLGLATIVMGILPVITANRQISFPRFSHYALPASLGVAFLVVGLVNLLSNRRAQITANVALVALSVLALQGQGAAAVREEQTIASFWHQMAWRTPAIRPGTTLLVFYPEVDYGTDSDVAWGPANFVYYPDRQDELPVRVALPAMSADSDSVRRILERAPAVQSTYRTHSMSIDPSNILFAIQAAPDTCVRLVADSDAIVSTQDTVVARVLAPFSTLEGVSVVGGSPSLLLKIFGPELEHGWCYYFQLASRAAQAHDWQQVSELYEEAGRLDLQPNDQIEWMPFLKAKAILGDEQAVKDISTRINTEPLYREQACNNLLSLDSIPLAMRETVTDLFRCPIGP